LRSLFFLPLCAKGIRPNLPHGQRLKLLSHAYTGDVQVIFFLTKTPSGFAYLQPTMSLIANTANMRRFYNVLAVNILSEMCTNSLSFAMLFAVNSIAFGRQ
jgi:hypothetical protein